MGYLQDTTKFANLFEKAKYLIITIQRLSLAKTHQEIRNIVKHAARELVGSDGATFVLRDYDKCYYVDEYAIAPLWKGKKFPMSACISGWVMLNKAIAVIPDIYKDPRIPAEAYRPTFVKSLVMVPIRKIEPIGAIGNYWQNFYKPSAEDISLLEALADSTAIAMENVNVYQQLEQRVEQRTKQLAIANKELEAFSYSVSHDLRAPLRAINGFTQLLVQENLQELPASFPSKLNKIINNANKMEELIEGLLLLSRIIKGDIEHNKINFSHICQTILQDYKEAQSHVLEYFIDKNIELIGDRKLLRILAENLLGNAIKFSSKNTRQNIKVKKTNKDKNIIISIQDNGVGFPMEMANYIFDPFKRVNNKLPGTGIGLAIVKRIIERHNGDIWVKSIEGKGTTFYLSFPGAENLRNVHAYE